MKKTAIAIVSFLIIVLTMSSELDAANPCFSALATDLTVHVPALSFAGSLFTLDLDYRTTGPTTEQAIWFKYAASGASSLTTCSYPAALFIDTGKFTLRLPMITYEVTSFWLELEYVPSTDGQIWFKVANFGLMPNRVFVTSAKGNGDLESWSGAGGKTGLEAGDAICQARATAAGLLGTFRAWLSDDNNDAYCRVHGLSGKKSANCGQTALPVSAGPWVRTDGFPFGDTIGYLLTDGKVYVPAATDEFGAGISDVTTYFTATGTQGTLNPFVPNSCSNWTAATADYLDGGYSIWTSYTWGDSASVTCDDIASLICFETGAGPPLPDFAVPGKRVFATSTTGTGNLASWAGTGGLTGIAAGDAICKARAAAAGLPDAGRFKAWLSDSSIDARNRITSDGPWVRLDGVKIADNKADLLDGKLFSPINLTETLRYLSIFDDVWAGTDSAGLRTTDACGDWQSTSSAGSKGRAADVESWVSGSKLPCDSNAALYCFED